MSSRDFLNLYIYSDSLAFRRPQQPDDVAFTYPFVLKEMIERRLGIRTNLLLRGGGGAHIGSIKTVVTQDSGYFGTLDAACNIAVFQVGIVDCAPRPITYCLAPLLERLPRLGPRILAILVKKRKGIQILWNYRLTSMSRFAREYKAILKTCGAFDILPVTVGLPLPPVSMEARSPGFRESARAYNELIRATSPDAFCDIEGHMTDTSRNSYLLSDGHHLTVEGHHLYAELLFDKLQGCLQAIPSVKEKF